MINTLEDIAALSESVGLECKLAAWQDDTPQDVGRNKPARRQQGRAFPAIGLPETPILRLTRGQAYSGLLRNVNNGKYRVWGQVVASARMNHA